MVAAAPLLLLIFLLSCFTLPCYSLTVYYTNSSTTPPSFLTLTIPSVYATVGALPTTSARLSLITMQHETCHFMIDMTGYAYVYTGSLLKDLFADCNTMDTASGVTVAKLAQDAGASVVILGAFYKFEDGRAIGFTKHITVPVIIIPLHYMQLFLSPDITNVSVEYDPITSFEKGRIDYLKGLWYAWRSMACILYGVLLVLAAHLLYKEIRKYQARGRKLTTGLIMRGFAVYCMLVSLLWVAADPFGFDGRLDWSSGLVLDLQLSSVVITFYLILLLWIQAVGKMNFHSKDVIRRLIYGFCIVLWVVAIIFGLPQWGTNKLNRAFSYLVIICFALVDVFFCIMGRDMVKVLLQAPSSSSSRVPLILKIVLFILWFTSVNVGVTSVYLLGILGHVFELMFVVLFEALALLGTFLILFFQPFKKETKHHIQVDVS